MATNHMDYKKQIENVRSFVEQLKSARSAIREIEDSILDIERRVISIDGSLPDADSLHGEERAQLLHLYDLTNEAFDLVDEILGPPDDETTGAPLGTAYMPEARGNGDEVSIDEILSNIRKPSGRHAS